MQQSGELTNLTDFVGKLDPSKFQDKPMLSDSLGIKRHELTKGFSMADKVIRQNLNEDGESEIVLINKIKSEKDPSVPGYEKSITEVFKRNMIDLGSLEGFLVGYSFVKKYEDIQFRNGLRIVSTMGYVQLWRESIKPVEYIRDIAREININKSKDDLPDALGLPFETWVKVKKAAAAVVIRHYAEIVSGYPLQLPLEFLVAVHVLEENILLFDRKTDLITIPSDADDAGFLFSIACLEVSRAAVEAWNETWYLK